MRRLAGLLAGAVALVGCSQHSAPPRQPAAPDLRVTVLQQRVDEATRTVGVEVTNKTGAVVHVSSVRLSGGGVDGPTTPVDTDLQPGLTVALRTSYGRPSCGSRGGVVDAYLQIAGRDLRYQVNDAGRAQMRRLLDADCATIALFQSVRVRLAGPYREVVIAGAPRLRGRLVVTRRAAGPAVDLRSLGGSVLIDLRPANGLVDLASAAERAVTPVLLGSNGRCDPHALGGSTQTFLLSAYVRVGDGPEQRVVLTPPRRIQGRVLDVVDRDCGRSAP